MADLSDQQKAARAERRRIRREKQHAKRKKAQMLSGKTFKGTPGHRCKAKTRSTGEPCPMHRAILEHPKTGKLYRAATCYAHLPPKIQEMFEAKPVGGKIPGNGGARKRPTPNTVLKQIFEQEVTTWIKPYLEALKAEKPIVVGNGRHARVQMVPDHRTRQNAAEAIWDRLYGKPKQQTEFSGEVEITSVEVPKSKDRALEVAQILAAAGAVPDQQQKVDKVAMAAGAASNN